jgi:hypothetical protein
MKRKLIVLEAVIFCSACGVLFALAVIGMMK